MRLITKVIRGVVTTFYKFIWHVGPETAGYFGVVVGLMAANATGLHGWWLHGAQGLLAGFVGENIGYYGVMYLQYRFIPLEAKLTMRAVKPGFPACPDWRAIMREVRRRYGFAEAADAPSRPIITSLVMAGLMSGNEIVAHGVELLRLEQLAQLLGLETEAFIAKSFAELWFYLLVVLTSIVGWGWGRRKQRKQSSAAQQWEPTS